MPTCSDNAKGGRPMPRLSIALLALLLTAGCAGTPPTRFYTLASVAPPAPLAALPELSLGLGPVTLPDTLDRPQIVTRKDVYGLELNDSHRWGGDLKANLERHLGERLKSLLGTQRIYPHPWPRHRRLNYQARIDVLRFDGQLDGEAQLSGAWALLDGAGRHELHLQTFSLKESVVGPEYRNLVAAMSSLANRLAEQIATVVAGQMK